MAFLIDKNVLTKNLDEVSPAFDEFRRVLNTTPTIEEYGNMISLALGSESSDNSILYYPSAPANDDYITTTTVKPISAEDLLGSIATTSSYNFTISADSLPPSTLMIGEKTIEEIVEEKVEQYKELMRLQALGCKNCGGSIDKETMICNYCGTRYRN